MPRCGTCPPISAGQSRVDVGCTARGQHRRLVPPAHRHHRTRRPLLGHGIREGQAMIATHSSASADRSSSPARQPRQRAHPAPATGTPPARRGPRPTPGSARSVLSRPYRPRTPPEPAHPRRHSGPWAATKPTNTRKRSTTQERDLLITLLADSPVKAQQPQHSRSVAIMAATHQGWLIP